MAWLKSFKQQAAFENLGAAIISAAADCAHEARRHFNIPSDADASLAWCQTITELVFGFLHIADRVSFDLVGDEKRTIFQKLLGPLVRDLFVNTFFNNWPTHLRQGIADSFFDDLNEAHMSYAKCKDLLIEDHPFSDDAVFPKLAQSVAAVGRITNPVTIFGISHEAVQNYFALYPFIDAAVKRV